MNKDFKQSLVCPDCAAEIVFDFYSLMKGEKAKCKSCGIELSIATESIERLEEAIEDLKKLDEESTGE